MSRRAAANSSWLSEVVSRASQGALWIRAGVVLWGAVLLVLVPGGQACAQTSPGERGQALIDGLSKGAVPELVGEAELSGRLETGGGRTYVLQTKTQRVSREGVELYRIRDRLRVDLGGLGIARIRVEGDLRLDFSPERLLLVSEEPRGRGLIVETRIELRRQGKGWVRSVSQGQGAPQLSTLERPSLVLTPPLGVGLRLARVAPAELGQRYSLAALDLETGLATRWRLSVDDQLQLQLKPDAEGEASPTPKLVAKPVPGSVLTWREGGASFVGWRPTRPASHLVRLAVRGQARLEVRSDRLRNARPLASGPAAAAASFLRAVARRDRAAIEASLDVPALLVAARVRGGLSPESTKADLVRFRRVLLERLTDEPWLEERGLRLGFASAQPKSFAKVGLGPKLARVSLKEHPEWSFELRLEGDSWQITLLPGLSAKLQPEKR